MAFCDRIKEIRTKNELSQQAFADRLKISKPSIQNYENPAYEKKPNKAVIDSICREFGINKLWLETGEGPMEDDGVQFAMYVRKLWPDISDRAMQFLKQVNDVPGGMNNLVETLEALSMYVNKNPEA